MSFILPVGCGAPTIHRKTANSLHGWVNIDRYQITTTWNDAKCDAGIDSVTGNRVLLNVHQLRIIESIPNTHSIIHTVNRLQRKHHQTGEITYDYSYISRTVPAQENTKEQTGNSRINCNFSEDMDLSFGRAIGGPFETRYAEDQSGWLRAIAEPWAIAVASESESLNPTELATRIRLAALPTEDHQISIPGSLRQHCKQRRKNTSDFCDKELIPVSPGSSLLTHLVNAENTCASALEIAVLHCYSQQKHEDKVLCSDAYKYTLDECVQGKWLAP